jgi:TolB protein
MNKLFFVILVLSAFFSAGVFAQEQESNLTVVAVGEATLEKDKMIFQDPYFQSSVSSGQKAAANEFVTLLRNDFSFYQKKFFLVEAGTNNTSAKPSTNYEYWENKGVRFLGTVQVERGGDGIKLNVIIEDIKQKKLIFNAITTTSITNLRKTGHEVANNIYKQIVGKESIFKSKIIL